MNILTFFYLIGFILLLTFAALVVYADDANAVVGCDHHLGWCNDTIAAQQLILDGKDTKFNLYNSQTMEYKKQWLLDNYPVITVWIQKYYAEEIEYRWLIATLVLVPTKEMMPFEEFKPCYQSTGCWDASDASIWIVDGREGWPSKIGCSVLYHEVLHAKGLSHNDMENDIRYANWACAAGRN